MKTRQVILPAICCLPFFTGCASHQSASVESWTIKPMANIRHSSDKPEALYQLGRYYQGQNRHELAISAYQRALVADSHFAEAHNGLGVVYSMQGRHKEAIEAFRTAAQLEPKASHIYSNLGHAYYAQGLYADAIVALQYATALDPTNQRALNNLGLAYAKAGNPGGSTLAFAKAANAQAAPAPATEGAPAPHSIAQSAPGKVVHDATPAAAAPQVATVEPLSHKPTPPAHSGGIITQTASGNAVPVTESRFKVVQMTPHVYELRERNPAPVKTLATTDNPPVAPGALAKKPRIEVSNGNGVTGMAKKVGGFLRDGGYHAARLTNQKPFRVKLTQIQYRDGYQTQARQLQSSLPGQPAMIMSNDMNADIGVRLLLGKDIARHTAYFDSKQGKVRLAQNKPGGD
jgi:Tfp pilus assembly protein PilF